MRILFSAILLVSAFNLVAQNNQSNSGPSTQPAHERYWTFGWDFGIIGYSPNENDHLEGTDFFTRTKNSGIGVVTDV
ncbi:MAG TPA: hypothetical protein VL651_03425, partial [Bacteroidia bacterium]|nr:hypothetical protein [Bacteroidia bacterium]